MRPLRDLFVPLALATASLAACSKEAPPSPGATQTAVPASAATPSTGPVASTAPEPSNRGPGAGGGDDEHDAPAPAKTYACGSKGQPKCPMQAWMKKHMAAASADGDGPALAKLFDYVAAHAPPGYATWASIANEGAAKARAGDIDGAKASCKSCHREYKAKYKAELRDRPF